MDLLKTVFGIDVSSRKSNVCIMVNGQKVNDYAISNDMVGFNRLLGDLKQVTKPQIIFEATGVYSRRLQAFLDMHELRYVMMNPLEAKRKTKDDLHQNKTDKLDAKFLGGLHPSDHIPTVYIPTLKEEGRRDAEREWDRIKTSIGRVNSQMIALIERTALPGFESHQTSIEWRKAISRWSKLPEWKECPELLLLRLPNLIAELELFEKELTDWKQIIQNFLERDEEAAQTTDNEDSTSATVRKLQQFKGVGDRLSRHLPWEIGDFRRFASGKQFAAFFGLTPCPYSSGTMRRDQGISKAGRKSLRKMAVECAWLWYRWQKNSHLVKKWEDRLEQKGRIRRTAIVALARQLMVALWRYVVKGETIEGAIINKPIEA